MTHNQINYANLQEEVRHNQMTEQQAIEANRLRSQELSEQQRHALIMESETNRANLASEVLRKDSNVINAIQASTAAKNAETSRRMQEETGRANLVNEARADQVAVYDNLESFARMEQAQAQTSKIKEERDYIDKNYTLNWTNAMVNVARAQFDAQLETSKFQRDTINGFFGNMLRMIPMFK